MYGPKEQKSTNIIKVKKSVIGGQQTDFHQEVLFLRLRSDQTSQMPSESYPAGF